MIRNYLNNSNVYHINDLLSETNKRKTIELVLAWRMICKSLKIPMEGPQRCLGLKQFFAILGILSGASIFVSFAYVRNVNAALWGLLSGIFAAIVLNLHINYRRRVLHKSYTPESLRIVKLCGLLLSFATLTASIVYFILMAIYHQGYKMEGNGYAPAAIFALLALKWTVMMYFEGRKYERFLVTSASEVSPIANGGPSAPASPPPYEAIKP